MERDGAKVGLYTYFKDSRHLKAADNIVVQLHFLIFKNSRFDCSENLVCEISRIFVRSDTRRVLNFDYF